MSRLVSRLGFIAMFLALSLGAVTMPPAFATASPPDTAILRGPEAYLCPDCIPDAAYIADIAQFQEAEAAMAAWVAAGSIPPAPPAAAMHPETWDPANAVDVYGAPSYINSDVAYLWVAAIPDVNATYECRFDGVDPFVACPTLEFDAGILPAGAYRIPLSGLTPGSHTLDVRSVVSGVWDPTPASQAFTVDLTPPGPANIETGPAIASASSTANFTLSKPVGEPVHLECAFDDTAFLDQGLSTPMTKPATLAGVRSWEPDVEPKAGSGWDVCGSSYTAPGLSDGVHRLSALAVDWAGNPSATSYGAPNGKETKPNFDYWTFKVDATGPKVTIYDAPIGTVGTGTGDVSFLANEPATFECKLDAGAWASCTSPAPFSGLSDGGHTFSVRGTDLFGNLGAVATASWTVDTSPPDTTITSGPSVWGTSSTATFVFNSSKAGSTLECQFDGGPWAACTSPKSYPGLLDGSAHTFGVVATDQWGHVDPTPATRAWTVDITPPAVTITGGPTGIVIVSGASFTFTGSDGGSGLAGFECQVDAGGWSACTSPDNVAVANGAHTFYVRATDNAGNTATDTRSWTANAPPAPNTSIDTGPSGTVPTGDATFTFSSDVVTATFECQLDSGGWAACLTPKSYTGLLNGPHTFEVRATDAGNADLTPASRTWTVDIPAPNTTINSSTIVLATASFTFSSDQSPVTFECQLDSGGWAACTSPKSYSGVTNGSHTFSVRATNTSTLLVDATPATHTWTVVNYRPDAMIRPAGVGVFTGNDLYADEFYHDATGQTVQSNVRRGSSTSFVMRMQNDGVLADWFTVKGCGSSNGRVPRYVVGGTNVTTRVVAGTYVSPSLAPGATLDMTLTIAASSSATGMQGCNVKFTSAHAPATYDWNRAETKITLLRYGR